MGRLNQKLNRATTNAAHEANSRVITTAGTVMITEFRKCCPKSPWCQASA